MIHPTSEERSQELPFSPSGFFVLRTPLLPFDELSRWGEGLEAPRFQPDSPELVQALRRDRLILRVRLGEILRRMEVREALFVASPALYESLGQWERDPESERGEKVERSVVRYLARMTGRSTPFGLFAGYSVGALGERTRLRLAPRATYQRHTRLDMAYACMLSEALSRAPELRPHIPHRPNSSLYRASGRLRYAEARMVEKTRSYHLVAVEPTEYLEAMLTHASAGARPEALVRALVEMDPEISLPEATEYIDELINSQLLVSELSPSVTGAEAVPELLSQLQQLPRGAPCAGVLMEVQSALEHLDRCGPGAPIDHYLEVAQKLSRLPAPVELPRLFQVDMVKPAPEFVLGREVTRELERGVRLLHRITPSPPQDALERFREAFLQRYEGREVPLLEALDEEAGVGFRQSNAPSAEATPLLAGLALGGAPDRHMRFGEREAFLLRRLEETLRTGNLALELDDKDLERLEVKDRQPLPDSFAAIATLVAESETALTRGNFQLRLHAASGPSGANLLGRFCHGDPLLHRKVEEVLRAEEALRPGAVFAEIVHLPQGRVGNILARPVLRQYELTYLGRSGAPPERQLDASDLRISIQGSRIVLHSARLGREVIPRMTNAHNFGPQSLALYHFLCALQHQDHCGGVTWSWGPLVNASFLPRVTHRRLVLSPATWKLWRDTLERLGELDRDQRFAAFQALRAERRMPRFVALEDGDNLLPTDLDNVLGVETLLQLLKGRSLATLVEVFPGPNELCVEGPEGRFVHDLVVPFVRSQPTVEATRVSALSRSVGAPRLSSQPRSFLPGSEWLYVKLYTGAATADRILSDTVAPLVKSALGSGAADGWFFIRYSDPDWHLRLRLHGSPKRLHELAGELPGLLEPLQREQLLWKLQFDTYEREVERYGGPEAILLAERLFQVDSEAVLELLELLRGDEGADARWRLTLCGMARLLSDLRLGLDTRLRVLTSLREMFGREFHVERATEHQLTERFRKERRSLEELLGSERGGSPELTRGLQVLQRRSERLAPIVTELSALAGRGKLGVPIPELAGSFLHMHANRMMRAAARAQELVLYDLLARHYASLVARQRKSGSTS
ncbi:Lanthionine biosynthesis protein LanB [Archangium minus]|uniref:Lanthionine biosynthesis protein LanB n=1 Tax=Archangium minus TaxID=83450 RepID=A0ABY9WUJ0_9BACT|nr:Lanthionine biosynthesis protein LanB [Archangium violaceum]WNG46963.1 Lanthionine biosynthesis protein LanB [Archangium minus]